VNREIESSKEVDRIIELSMLYDFYGALLKEHKRLIFEDYILNDLSLSEIANEQGISRQGVYDLVKRCSKELEEYEDKLSLIKKFLKTKENVKKIQQAAKEIRSKVELKQIETIEELSNRILEEL
jgi:uncharacterized protein